MSQGIVLFLALALPAGWGGAGTAHAEDEPPPKLSPEAQAAADKDAAEQKEAEAAAARLVLRYARERLLQKARDTVDPARRSAGSLEAIRQTLIKKDALYKTLQPDAWTLLENLLGPLTTQGESDDGLIRQAALFYRWMQGGKESTEVPALTFQDPTGRGIEVIEEDGAVAAERLTSLPVDSELVTTEVLAEWTLQQERDPEWGGQVVATGIDKLRAVEEPLSKIALSPADELFLRYSRRYVDTRQRQVGPRVAALKADVPSAGLVSAAAVRTREERATRMRERVNRILAMQAGVERGLDRLVQLEKELTRASGGLGFEIEEARNAFEQVQKQKAEAEAKAKAEAAANAEANAEAGPQGEGGAEGEAEAPLPLEDEPAPDEGSEGEAGADPLAGMHPTEVALERLRLREIVDAQKLRLLYITVRRAELRLELLDGVLNQVKEEAVAAEDAHQRFVIALATIRRERQMDRLTYEATELDLVHKKAHRTATEGEEAARPIWAAYDQALEALIKVNTATINGVKMRRDLEARTQPLDEGALEGCLPEDESAAGEGAEDGGANIDPLSRFRTCRAASLDPIYVKDALTMLDHPGWDSIMTARHYEAVDDRIADLESALSIIKQAETLQSRFDQAVTGAQAALAQVETLSEKASDWYEWRVKLREARAEWLVPNQKAFQETMRGVQDEIVHVKDDLATYRTFRERLLHLGKRSFRVRVQRELDTDKLGTAYTDSMAALRGAGRWVSLQGESHLGTWIQGNWKLLLGCLGVLLASIGLLRYGRRGLDALLSRMARRIASLQAEPVAVGAEQQQARLAKQLAEEAAKAEEEAALREVSKGEADKAQRMGEGGYAGGAS